VLANYLLSFLIWLPIFGGVALLLIGDADDAKSPQARLMRSAALAFTILTFLASIVMYIGFDNAEPGMQFIERKLWIGAFDVWYYLGIDGISAPLILLTTFITPLVVIAGWDSIKSRPAQYFAAFLILEGLMIGVFSALDGLLFYVFWEAMLIPMFLIIGVWGGEPAGRYVQPDRVHEPADRPEHAETHLPRVPVRVCRQGADVARAYVVAGRAR
jgi:NADH-quinone oxidoreductase subunit M